MFGNIKPLRTELTIRDYTNYRAYYCGICKSMGKRYRGLCNMGLSYEAVFLAVLLSAMTDDKVTVKDQRCMMHPFVKRPMAVHNNSIDKAAAVNVLLMYNSLVDNVNDEKDLKSRIGTWWFKKPYKKAAKADPELNKLIEEKLDDLFCTEASLCDVVDKAAEPFAELMGELAARLVDDAGEEIYWFGFFLGKWIYVIDAYDDIEKDKQSGSYNPFIRAYADLKADEIKQKAKDDAEFVLSGALRELGNIYESLSIKRNKEIIENILFEGMPKRTKDVIEGIRTCKNKGEYEI